MWLSGFVHLTPTTSLRQDPLVMLGERTLSGEGGVELETRQGEKRKEGQGKEEAWVLPIFSEIFELFINVDLFAV